MSCDCFKQWLKIQTRTGIGGASPCGWQWDGSGMAFSNIRKVRTVVVEYTHGTITTVLTFADQIASGDDSCDPYTVEDDREEGKEYGDVISIEYSHSDPYTSGPILAAADADAEADRDGKSWGSESHYKYHTAADMSGAGRNGLTLPTIPASNHYIISEGDPGFANWSAYAQSTQVRFILAGPQLPCRVDYELTHGETGSFMLTDMSNEHILDLPYNTDNVEIEAGGAGSGVGFQKVLAYFSPWHNRNAGLTGTESNDSIDHDNHGFETGDEVKFALLEGGEGLQTGTSYYVIKTGDGSYKLAASFADAEAGTAVAYTTDITNAVVIKID